MVSSNMKIISCVRFELDFRGQIFTDDAGYFLRITYSNMKRAMSPSSILIVLLLKSALPVWVSSFTFVLKRMSSRAGLQQSRFCTARYWCFPLRSVDTTAPSPEISSISMLLCGICVISVVPLGI